MSCSKWSKSLHSTNNSSCLEWDIYNHHNHNNNHKSSTSNESGSFWPWIGTKHIIPSFVVKKIVVIAFTMPNEFCYMYPRHILTSYLRWHEGLLHISLRYLMILMSLWQGPFNMCVCVIPLDGSIHVIIQEIMDLSHVWNESLMAHKYWLSVAMGVYGEMIW